MKILILTQNESEYLPESIQQVCKSLSDEIVAIVVSPAMSTHGGMFKGIVKHVMFFGIINSIILTLKIMRSKTLGFLKRNSKNSPYYSLKQVAYAFHIPFHDIKKVKSREFQLLLEKHNPDLLISISCPQIIGKKIRRQFRLGCINVHGGALPKYRGLMPTFWAMRNGENQCAVTVHDLKAKLDDGDILIQERIPILAEDTWDSLVRKVKKTGAKILIEAINQIRDGKVKRIPNLESESTYFSFPTVKDRKLFLASGRKFF